MPCAGLYRVRHFGDYKEIFGGTVSFDGSSTLFQVGAAELPTGCQWWKGQGLKWGTLVTFLLTGSIYYLFSTPVS